MRRNTLDRALDLALALATIVIVIEQRRDLPIRPALLRAAAAGAGTVARAAGQLALAAEAAYAREVEP